jgi:hypothetical protein
MKQKYVSGLNIANPRLFRPQAEKNRRPYSGYRNWPMRQTLIGITARLGASITRVPRRPRPDQSQKQGQWQLKQKNEGAHSPLVRLTPSRAADHINLNKIVQ